MRVRLVKLAWLPREERYTHLDKRERTVNTGGDATGRPDVTVHNPTSLSIQKSVSIHPLKAKTAHLRHPVYIWAGGLDPRKGGLVGGCTTSVEDTRARKNRCTSAHRQHIPKIDQMTYFIQYDRLT